MLNPIERPEMSDPNEHARSHTESRVDTQSSPDEHERLLALGFPHQTNLRRATKRLVDRLRDDSGAVTAEYALIIMAGVAFAGALILIMRSDEVRAMLLDLVQNALQSAS